MQIRFPVLAIAASLLSACIVELPSGQSPPSLDDRQPVFTQGTAGRNPIIQSFTANPSNVTKGQPVTFQVVASDPDRNPLQLNWSATDGTLSTNTGQVVSWIPPEKPGVYSVTVTVANGRGGFVTGTQNLTVQENGSAVIGGKPTTPPVTTVSPTPLPSVLPSAIPSVVVTPPPASATPSAVPQVTPSPSPSPLASAKPYVQLDYTSQEARFGVPSPDRASGPSEFVRLKVASASDTKYAATLLELTATPAAFYNQIDVKADGTGQTGFIYKGVHLLYFIRADQSSAGGAGGLEKVRLKDGPLGTVGLPLQAATMARANVQIPDGAWVNRNLNGCIFAFKFDGGQLDLGTFNLP